MGLNTRTIKVPASKAKIVFWTNLYCINLVCFYVFNWHKRRSKLVQQFKNFSIFSTLQAILKLVCTYILSKPIYVYFYLSQSITNDWIVHAIRQPFYRTARPIPTHGPIECTIGPTTLWSRILISTLYEFIGVFSYVQ